MFPVTVDPVYDTAAWTFTGEGVFSYLGRSVDGAGDVNGDGYDDVILGAPGYSNSTGRAYVFEGSASGLATAAATVLTGGFALDALGDTVAGVGDVNGDGYDDVVVSVPGSASWTGRVDVFLGSAAGLSTRAQTILEGDGKAGYALAGAGDVNGDGYDDVVVGAVGVGRAFLYPGSAAGLATAPIVLSGGAGFGTAVAGAGDIDGDGYDDVIIGAPAGEGSSGRVYVFMGSSEGILTIAAATLTVNGLNPSFGQTLAGGGDVNHDGFADVVVGAPSFSSTSGRVYVYTGGAGGLAPIAATVLTGSAGSGFGSSVDAVGDADGDGYSDLIVGATGAGHAYLYDGSAAGLPTTVATTLVGPEYPFGDALAGAGDVNGDGCDDLIAGSFGAEGKFGSAYLYNGYYLDQDGDGLPADLDCDDGDAAVGLVPLVPRFLDADGDGLGDPAVSALVCASVVGYVAANTDCDDSDSAVGAAIERFADADADGLGDPAASAVVCPSVPGYVASGEDCDDADAAVGVAVEQYRDADADGFGDPRIRSDVCPRTPGYVANSADCDDADPALGAAVDARYRDADRDGYGDPSRSAVVCPSIDGYVATGDDCDDANSAIGNGAEQFVDADADGYGDPATSAFLCVSMLGYVANASDCDDASAAINPDAQDIGDDGIDQNCSGRDAHLIGCGCSTSGGANGLGALAVLLAVVAGRRRPRP